jgi:hypothetical protein
LQKQQIAFSAMINTEKHGSFARREAERRHILGMLDASTSPPKERYAASNDNVSSGTSGGAD